MEGRPSTSSGRLQAFGEGDEASASETGEEEEVEGVKEGESVPER
jgi:hypothetical protein